MFLQHLCVDHDHKSGAVRGLLCNACNTAIGLFEEDAQRFLAVLEYVQSRVGAGNALWTMPNVIVGPR